MGQTEKYKLPYPSEEDYLKDTPTFIKNLAETTETSMETLEDKKLDKTSKATSTEAIAGTNNTKYTTPASVKSAIDKALEGYTPSSGGKKEVGYADETLEGTEVILIEESDFAGENSIELAKVEQNLSSNSEDKVPSVKAVNDAVKTNIVIGQEVATNEYIDGKQVFVKRFDIGTLPNNSVSTIPIGTDFSNCTVIKLYGIAKNTSTNVYYPLPFVWRDSTDQVGLFLEGNSIRIATNYDKTPFNQCFVTIHYTKN